ncbi:MAG: protein translocase SEC61 complex subunit gamma [Thermoproteota archaeon]
MRLTERVKTMARVLKLSEKPDWPELKLSLKIFLIGILIVGGMAFVIHIVASLLQLTGVRLE